jgi:addiction module RelE/StbE family toxin
MKVAYSSNFNKKIKKIPKKVIDRFYERLELFEENIFHPLLDNHKLHGKYEGCSSINITGNFRAIFEYFDEDSIVFSNIGTHAELYE